MGVLPLVSSVCRALLPAFAGLGNRYQGRTQNAVIEQVALLEHLHHAARGLARLDEGHCLVPVRIVLLADRIDLDDPLLIERGLQVL